MSEPNNRDTIIREPLLSDSVIATGGDMDHPRGLSPYQVRDHYEAARAKDAELIQRFVDHNAKWAGYGCLEADREWDDIITDCFKAGFTTTEG